MDYDKITKEFIENMQVIRTANHKGYMPEGLTGETFVLHFISGSQGKVVPSKISNSIGISSARVATALNSLEDKGLVTRRIDSDDRRKIIVEMTPEGTDYVRKLHKQAEEKLKELLISLGE